MKIFRHSTHTVYDMPDVMKVQTLIHEWVHGAFVMIGRNDLTDDENLVQCLAVAINNTFTIREDKTE